MSPLNAEVRIEKLLRKTVEGNRDLHHGILLVHSDRHDIHWKFAHGTTGRDTMNITPDHTFHIASIGKSFTSAVISRLQEEGKLAFDDPIKNYLPDEILKDLHVYNGTSYIDQVTIAQLLNHTSGIADYFEDKPKQGESIQELAITEPDRFWSPKETIEWTIEHLNAHFPPGKDFHYSDTGYQLLGLIIEEITGKPLHEILHELIFNPLGMVNSYQLFYSEPAKKSPYPLADIYLGKNEVSTFRSISVDWAGGGIVSTTEDLLLFHRALVENRLIKEETFAQWQDWKPFARGIDYGYGLVSLKFKEFMFLLPEKMNMWGNWGSTATFMFYNPVFDIYLIGAFNHSRFIRKQVQFIIKVMNVLIKEIEKQ